MSTRYTHTTSASLTPRRSCPVQIPGNEVPTRLVREGGTSWPSQVG